MSNAEMNLEAGIKDRFITVAKDFITTSVDHRPHTESPTTEARVYTVLSYTRMKFGPVYIFGVVGGNSSANSTWDQYRIYGLLDSTLYRHENLSCCLLYREHGEMVTVHTHIISETRRRTVAPMWAFHVGCSNGKHSQGIHKPDYLFLGQSFFYMYMRIHRYIAGVTCMIGTALCLTMSEYK